MTDDIYHFGVKGMKWGVRRSPEQLRKSREKLSSKAEKLHEKTTARDEKWAQKKIRKGKAEKVLQKHDRLLNAKTAESYERAAALRTKQFDTMVDRQLKKDPKFKSTMTAKEKAYLEKKAIDKVTSSNFMQMWAKKQIIDTVVDKAADKYSNDYMSAKEIATMNLGKGISKLVLNSTLSKTNKRNMRDMGFLSAYETSQRRVDIINRELNKTTSRR